MTTNRTRRRRQRCWNDHRRTIRWAKTRNPFTLIVRHYRPGTRRPHAPLMVFEFDVRVAASEWRDESVL